VVSTPQEDDGDALRDALDELVREAQREVGGPMSNGAREQRIEAIESADCWTFILLATGHRAEDFHVAVCGEFIRVEAPDMEAAASFSGGVDERSLDWQYNNGVLTARVSKT
jgi:hypothetical protein